MDLGRGKLRRNRINTLYNGSSSTCFVIRQYFLDKVEELVMQNFKTFYGRYKRNRVTIDTNPLERHNVFFIHVHCTCLYYTDYDNMLCSFTPSLWSYLDKW